MVRQAGARATGGGVEPGTGAISLSLCGARVK
jgi:hypothetical protein